MFIHLNSITPVNYNKTKTIELCKKKEVILINLIVKNFSMKRFEKYILDYPVLGKHKPIASKLIYIKSSIHNV